MIINRFTILGRNCLEILTPKPPSFILKGQIKRQKSKKERQLEVSRFAGRIIAQKAEKRGMDMETAKNAIVSGTAVLGIEFGSTRICFGG